jgi:hypothetical protein
MARPNRIKGNGSSGNKTEVSDKERPYILLDAQLMSKNISFEDDLTQQDRAVEQNVAPVQPATVASTAEVGDESAINKCECGKQLMRRHIYCPACGKGTDMPRIWQDVRAAKLVDLLVSGKLAEITPTIDISLSSGAVYTQVDSALETRGTETINILEALARDHILIRKPFEKLRVDPEGSFQLVPVERCPHCDSGNLASGKLIEHFNCGNVGLEQDFKNDYKYVCSKCNRELKLLGTDYHYVGMQYKCLGCNEMFPTPLIKWRSLKTGKIWTVEELSDAWIYSYSFNVDKRDWLMFQLKPKVQIVDFLKKQGYQVQEQAQITGGSGAVHTVDILATRDDGLIKFQVGIGILTALPGEAEVNLRELFNFDTRCYDMHIDYKVVIPMPKLSAEAAKFAQQQNIQSFEAKDLSDLISFINRQVNLSPAESTVEEAIYHKEMGTLEWIQARVAAFLMNHGYEVFRNQTTIGKSGIGYTFDIFAQRDDIIVIPSLAIAIVSDSTGQEVGKDRVAQFDAEAFDAGIKNKTFVGIPEISPQARQLAQRLKMIVLGQKELESIIGYSTPH